METKYTDKILQNRLFLKSAFGLEEPSSPEQNGKPQPPFVKDMGLEKVIELPRDFEETLWTRDYAALLEERRSVRRFSPAAATVEQLSFILWSTQGIQKVIGNEKKATLRCVPSGGARHTFETYIAVQNIAELQPGLYHYQPLNHTLGFVRELDFATELEEALNGQVWAQKTAAILFWTCIPERCEWRYGLRAARLMAIDIGHVGQTAYLSAHAAGLCGCGIAAYRQQACDKMLGVDGENEFTVYAQGVGVPEE